MNYKEQIDEYFKRFKQTERTDHMYAVIVKEMGLKYQTLIEQGYTKAETQEKLSEQIKNLRAFYPVLSSLPRKNVGEEQMKSTILYVSVGLYLLFSAVLYWIAPIATIVPQFIMGFILLKWFQAYPHKLISVARRKLVLSFTVLLIIQMIAMNLRYINLFNGIGFILLLYGLSLGLFWLSYAMLHRHDIEIPERPLVFEIINGPVFVKNVNVLLYLMFLFSSGMMYIAHFAFVFLDSIFNSWYT